MTFAEFRALVASNAEWFGGDRRETSAALENAESVLGVVLPESLKCLLRDHGYSEACGIPSLENAVETTLRCRVVLGLPRRYVVLEDRNDAGVVFLDTGAHSDPESCPVYWVGSHNFGRLAQNEAMDSDCDSFAGFGERVASELDRAKEQASENGPDVVPGPNTGCSGR